MRRIASLLALIITCSAASACKPHKGGASEEQSAKPKDDPGRPSDDGEGVPGYLTNPEGIVVKPSGASGKLEISAGEGAVAAIDAAGGALDAVRISVWSLLRADLETATKAAKDGEPDVTVPGTRLGDLAVSAKGAFGGTMTCAASQACIVVLVSIPVDGDRIPLPKAYAENRVTAAVKRLADDEPTTAFILSALADLIDRLLTPTTPQCKIHLAKPCAALGVGVEDYDNGITIAEGETASEVCRKLTTTFALACQLLPGETMKATAYPGDSRDGAPVEVVAGTHAGCLLRLGAPCAAHPEVPQAIYDSFGGDDRLQDQCAPRPAEIAAYCRLPEGTKVTAEFRGTDAAEPVVFKTTAPAPGPEPEPTAVIPVRGCSGAPEGRKTTGYVLGDPIGCALRGFATWGTSFKVYRSSSAAHPVALRRYVTTPGDWQAETVVQDGETRDDPWRPEEVIGYVAPASGEGLVPIYRCVAPQRANAEVVTSNLEYCEALAWPATVIGYGPALP